MPQIEYGSKKFAYRNPKTGELIIDPSPERMADLLKEEAASRTHLSLKNQPDAPEVAIKPAPPKPKRQTVNELLAIPAPKPEPKTEKKEPTGKPSLLDLC